MPTEKIYAGNTALQTSPKKVVGEILSIRDELFYRISDYDKMDPFFINIVSDSDLWMFISSNGALTAGRKNADNALFPYYTDDRIHDSHEITGSKSIFLVTKKDKTWLWEPFSNRYPAVYNTERHIYKNMIGNHLMIEEINHDLQLSFRYAWMNCDRFGFIRKAEIKNLDSDQVNINLLDGIQNILPAGISRRFQLEYSTLADGYKRTELLKETGLALYAMTSAPTDKAEPSEALKANIVWSTGLKDATILLSSRQLNAFRSGEQITEEVDVKAARGAYFVQSLLQLSPQEEKSWYLVADLNKDHSNVAEIQQFLSDQSDIDKVLEEEIQKSKSNLRGLIAGADGLQLTEDKANMFRHCSNTLFNIMRGGIFDDGYFFTKSDFIQFVQSSNYPLYEKHKNILEDLPTRFRREELFKRIKDTDPHLERLCYEYLPLTFSRRHGDPSRPWNHFSIIIRDEKGNKRLNYEGNWRDIFQNWEALALSFPEYVESMITRFVNSSTPDGYNPYRVTRNGFEWEELEPDDEWSYIGYWGDHQIIYLLKLLELSTKYHPGALHSLLSRELFTYANVPYRIKPYKAIVQDPHDTIDYDFEEAAKIQERVKQLGSNGKLVFDKSGEIYRVNLAEKIILPLLVKLSNLIPEAGIWMNTQRPEWNDANNALVGFGTSMVTLYYIRRYISFLDEVLKNAPTETVLLSDEVAEFLQGVSDIFNDHVSLLNQKLTDQQRKQITDLLGETGSKHRWTVYSQGFSGRKKEVNVQEIRAFLSLALQYCDHSIKANKREDDLYHSYNLIKFTEDNGISIRTMSEMLEGQVAVLSSGYLPHEDSVMLLNALKKSALYRKDQFTYILYPYKELPRFLEKNNIPEEMLRKSKLLQMMLESGDERIIMRDVSGKVHFNSDFRNSRVLNEALNQLVDIDKKLLEAERNIILNIYETIFDHQSFTGRSGTFYKYEGLGSIYWHMVSKLLLAVQETFFRALDDGAGLTLLDKLKNAYYDIREGIGVHKNPELYGAFPTDAYSHTPLFSGAQQPGMTGQVKEDVLSRFGEFGVRIVDGKITFEPALLNTNEFLKKSQVFEYIDVHGKDNTLMINQGMMAFTVCQVPVVYIPKQDEQIVVVMDNGEEKLIPGLELDEELSASIFNREGAVKNILVYLEI
ncbi:MAG: hypothetical protein Kow00108_15510 [Calditrichia bacterium]